MKTISCCAEVVHELSSCLARTAEQQQLLADAARLLIRGEVFAPVVPSAAQITLDDDTADLEGICMVQATCGSIVM